MMNNEQIFKRLYKNEYMVQLESMNADKAKRLATIHAVKHTAKVWRGQFEKDAK